ncbi:acyltransferase family protein [Dactylosporangium sp. CA-139066]|uniref:acyltransferase family protein n=1 Tax=Dactylosporangium sp. CA-139066 TaxID=3239930 RepID=UPI003D8CAA9E
MRRSRSGGSQAPSRLLIIDGLRFLAALSVAVFHLMAVAGRGAGTKVDVWGQPAKAVFPNLFKFASYGWVGVPLFFIISGFVICMSSWGRTPRQFLAARVSRLYPAYWACIAITTCVSMALPAVYKPVPPRALLANLTMLQDPLGAPRVDEVYVTLWAEMRFYALFTVLMLFGLTYRRVVWFCLGWSALSVWSLEWHQPWLGSILMPGGSQYFIGGIALFLVYKFGSRPVLWFIIGFSWILSMYFYAGNAWQGIKHQPYWPASVLITMVYVVFALISLGWFQNLKWRGLTVLGATSYPLYLLHYVIGLTVIYYLYQRLTISPRLFLALLIAALIGVAWLVHRLIERPLAPRLKAALAGFDLPARQRRAGGPGPEVKPEASDPATRIHEAQDAHVQPPEHEESRPVVPPQRGWLEVGDSLV